MEIDKLRQRLKNVGKGVTEYRMTVAEARDLVQEFEVLEKKLLEKDIPVATTPTPSATVPRILDGGHF